MTVSLNIDDLLSAYNKSDPKYKFTHIFYNISSTRIKPLEFPNAEWNEYLQKAPSELHVPVILKGFEELNERVKKQEELMKNINESSNYLINRMNNLKLQYKNIRYRIDNLVLACRDINQHNDEYEQDSLRDKIYNLKQKLRINRDPVRFVDTSEVKSVMWQFRTLGMKLKEDVEKYKRNK